VMAYHGSRVSLKRRQPDKLAGIARLEEVSPVLSCVLQYVDLSTLMRVELMCRAWHQAANDSWLWATRCRTAGLVPGCDPRSTFRLYGRNLLLDGHCDDLEAWAQTGAVRKEAPPMYAPRCPATPLMRRDTSCFVTSYYWGEVSQILDLPACGFSSVFLDSHPVLCVSGWFGARSDCLAQYEISVKAPFDVEQRVAKQGECHQRTWLYAELRVPLPQGTRKVEVRFRGRDLQFVAGIYGAKFTSLCTKFVTSADSGGAVTLNRQQPELLSA